MSLLKEILYGTLFFLALFLMTVLIWPLDAEAEEGRTTVIRLGVNDTFQVRCDDGIIEFHEKKRRVYWVCKEDEGPPEPPIDPPSGKCGDPTLPLSPKTPQSLPQQEFVNVFANTTRVYRFSSKDYANDTGRVSVAPTPKPSGKPSNSNLTVLSECPGFLDVDIQDNSQRACWAAGNQNNIAWRVGPTTRDVCGLKPDTLYYLNTSPRNPVNGKDTCGGVCSIVVNAGKQ